MDSLDVDGRWFAVLAGVVVFAATVGGLVTGMVVEAVVAALFVVSIAYLHFDYPL